MFVTYGTPLTDCRRTWNTENIPSKPEEIWELSVPTHPPMNRVAGLKVFWWKVEVLLQLVYDHFCLPVKMQSEVFLRRAWGCNCHAGCCGCKRRDLRWC